MSALQTLANPHRIKATHRRRRRIASGRFVQRYYDPELGRFLTPDPVGPEEDFINHFNRYNYAQNNPVRYTDPDGRSALILGIKFIAKGGDAAATFAGVVEDTNTVMDSNASLGDRFLAGVSLLSEAAPVSLRDGKAVVKMADKLGDAKKLSKSQLKGVNEHAVKKDIMGAKADISTHNISADKTGNVVLTPVKKGGESIPTDIKVKDLPKEFPKKK